MNPSNPERLEELDRGFILSKSTGWACWRLVMPQPHLATFRRSGGALAIAGPLCVAFVALALAPPILLAWWTWTGGLEWGSQMFVLAVGIAAILLVSDGLVLGLIYFKLMRPALRDKPFVFDKRQRRFWRQGHTDPVLGDYGLIGDIEALQICSYSVAQSNSRWVAYEINAVMKRPQSARVNICSSTKREALLEDAHKLAEFLNVPLLDHRAQE